LWLEVLARGKEDIYREWFEARNEIIEDLGYEPFQLIEVWNRTQRLMCVISPEGTAEEIQEFTVKIGADERFQELQREHRAAATVLDETSEQCRLNSVKTTRPPATGPEARGRQPAVQTKPAFVICSRKVDPQ
jgi:hypothetical protein